MPKAQETLLEINLSALQHNYNHLKSRIQNEAKFLAVVKAYSYGSDPCEIALFLEKLGVDYFAVAYINEGVQLRNAGVTKPILVLHPQTVNFNILMEHYLEPSLYNVKILKEFIEFASAHNLKHYPVHLKFNTGLNRLGFSENDINIITESCMNANSIHVTSMFSHLAASEDLNEKAFSLNQIESFKRISNNVMERLGYKPMLHMCNTSGILNFPEAHFDMVRSGIGLYGFGNSEKENKNFIPIGTLKTIISQIHFLNEGDSLGYNRSFISKSPTKTATLPIGHADGIGRQYGKGKGYVIINNKPAYIIGNVCMDMIMVDITHIDCQEGDEVIVFGPQASAEQLAETAQTISYELITSISQRVKRIFIK
ncbi:alanine racemase [Siansivirga zeaxanthinifaciens]|uniref:Alanine racemase n=1 Tax=Siansivirga zeaxanthinifaciens CC-SAMT-1 TaxID=1454006 RepID=A0A0C5WJZ2_9FLAO|nr:alanine racemase [Siansivirga zeaxanthinifaciens]AJR03065.1 alanine racemase [Siansivirga zeaxanthinifaciens CC-SAMT-1]